MNLLPFFFPLMTLAKDFSILFIISKNQLLVLLIFATVSFIYFSFIFALNFMISFLLLTLRFFGSSFSFFLRNKLRLSVQCFCLFVCFLMLDFITVSFPLRTAFAESHRSSCFHCHLFLGILIFHVISSVTSLFNNALFNLHKFAFFAVIFPVVDT